MEISLIIAVLLGLLGGYLVNYLADVLPDELKISHPTCKNPACRTQLDWKDYILLKRCSKCQKSTSLRNVIV
ncbi:MAG: hypothetical protein MUO76_03500, partial [Anaerolineaceae bacterium]|nr:hypothetical protein [Anaerolineaceae bacterium]